MLAGASGTGRCRDARGRCPLGPPDGASGARFLGDVIRNCFQKGSSIVPKLIQNWFKIDRQCIQQILRFPRCWSQISRRTEMRARRSSISVNWNYSHNEIFREIILQTIVQFDKEWLLANLKRWMHLTSCGFASELWVRGVSIWIDSQTEIISCFVKAVESNTVAGQN